ncbi:hypothetical protein CEXT_783041 [Caerostris extrusa]|uniref:Uncharacterized protein n=1 Tax=Caerostris extrusa TaxID=172846 RepID=A0AAV4R642_CAEEX|nr:hypothetical protein CEXT_783041 [Caerostris extrusa]
MDERCTVYSVPQYSTRSLARFQGGGDLRTKISKKPHPTWHGRMRLSLLPCRQSTIYWKTEIYQVRHHLLGVPHTSLLSGSVSRVMKRHSRIDCTESVGINTCIIDC